jgi:UDP-N-acetyl-D-glucosamine dehydrogenase
MPQYVLDQTLKALNAHQKALNGSKVLVIGLAYKPDVDDIRESPTFHIMDLLKDYGAEVEYYDPHIAEIKPTREHKNWMGIKSIDWDKEQIQRYDAVIIATDHSAVDYRQLAEWNNCIIDSRNCTKDIIPNGDNHIWKA